MAEPGCPAPGAAARSDLLTAQRVKRLHIDISVEHGRDPQCVDRTVRGHRRAVDDADLVRCWSGRKRDAPGDLAPGGVQEHQFRLGLCDAELRRGRGGVRLPTSRADRVSVASRSGPGRAACVGAEVEAAREASCAGSTACPPVAPWLPGGHSLVNSCCRCKCRVVAGMSTEPCCAARCGSEHGAEV